MKVKSLNANNNVATKLLQQYSSLSADEFESSMTIRLKIR